MILLWVLHLLGSASSFEKTLHRRFEYKHSFKGPNLIDSAMKVPFWEASGSCLPSEDYVRVTPSVRSKQGQLWNKIQYVGSNWDIEFSLKIQGRGKLGADGMAIWYVQDLAHTSGDVFGGPNNWRGLGIFFDSFDNDNRHDNPTVVAMLNDGTVGYDHGRDGKGQELESCIMGFRNKPHVSRVRMRYYQQVLSLEMNSGLTARDGDYEECFRKENVKLPPGGFFGVSAATGALADDHDISQFLVYSLYDQHEQAAPLDDDTKAKILADYDRYDKDLEEKKKVYRDKNPDKFMVDEVDEEQNFFYQTLIDQQIRLSVKFDELSKAVGKLSSQGQGSNQDTNALKALIEELKRMQGGVVRQIESHGAQMQSILSKVDTIVQKSTATQNNLNTVSSALGVTQTQLREIQNRKTHVCPSLPESGISFIHLLCVIIIQTSILMGYWIWRHRIEDARKKFF